MKARFTVELLVLISAGVIQSCVPQVFTQADYRSHLTKEEKARLQAGQMVEKIHTSYWRFKPSQIYWQGPLTVTSKNGKWQFEPHGTWNRYEQNGVLSDVTTYKEGLAYTRWFNPDGSLFRDQYCVDKPAEGKTEYTDIDFRAGNERDTTEIRRWIIGKGGIVSDERIGFDAQGKRQPLVKVK